MTGQWRANPPGKRRAPKKTRVTTRGKIVLGAVITLLLWGLMSLISGGSNPTSPPAQATDTLATTKQGAQSVRPSQTINAAKYSHTKASSLWVVVNKATPLKPVTYEPKLAMVRGFGVDARMAPNLTRLLAAAKAHKTRLSIISGYRSYDYQLKLYNERVAERGQKATDQLYARPGRSEHQTGLAADLDNLVPGKCRLDACFGSTPGGRWLAAHAADYGFVIRYPANAKTITGYNAEPWHIRYVGVELASYLAARHDETLEKFFGVNGGAGHPNSE